MAPFNCSQGQPCGHNCCWHTPGFFTPTANMDSVSGGGSSGAEAEPSSSDGVQENPFKTMPDADGEQENPFNKMPDGEQENPFKLSLVIDDQPCKIMPKIFH